MIVILLKIVYFVQDRSFTRSFYQTNAGFTRISWWITAYRVTIVVMIFHDISWCRVHKKSSISIRCAHWWCAHFWWGHIRACLHADFRRLTIFCRMIVSHCFCRNHDRIVHFCFFWDHDRDWFWICLNWNRDSFRLGLSFNSFRYTDRLNIRI